MINDREEYVRTVTAKVGSDPRYKGSIHDDASAAKFGFKSALVPGPTVCSYMTHMFVEAWGEDWIRHGTIFERNRRPVYEGQTVTATATPIQKTADGLSVSVVLCLPDGEEAAFATANMPNIRPARPDMARFPHRPHLEVTPPIKAGEHKAGDLFYSTPIHYTQEIHDTYLNKIGKEAPIFPGDKVIHPSQMLSMCMREAIASYVRPTPGIHVDFKAEHFDVAHVGDTLSTSGHITGVFEKKGHHYMESEQLVIANGNRPLVLFKRTSIYAARAVAA